MDQESLLIFQGQKSFEDVYVHFHIEIFDTDFFASYFFIRSV